VSLEGDVGKRTDWRNGMKSSPFGLVPFDFSRCIGRLRDAEAVPPAVFSFDESVIIRPPVRIVDSMGVMLGRGAGIDVGLRLVDGHVFPVHLRREAAPQRRRTWRFEIATARCWVSGMKCRQSRQQQGGEEDENPAARIGDEHSRLSSNTECPLLPKIRRLFIGALLVMPADRCARAAQNGSCTNKKPRLCRRGFERCSFGAEA
jgi:hypothetical protein